MRPKILTEVNGETGGQPVCVSDVSCHFRLGKPTVRILFGLFDVETSPNIVDMQEIVRSAIPYTPDVIFTIRPLVLCIAWAAVNQSVGAPLNPSENAATHSAFTQVPCVCGLLSCRPRRRRDPNVRPEWLRRPIFLVLPS